MRVEHIALWVNDLELMKKFYCDYFGFACGDIYRNHSKAFSSYFLCGDDGARLELMNAPGKISPDSRRNMMGLAHIAFSVGSESLVNELTERLRIDGYQVLSAPRTTGDGYYESVVADPEGNVIEITV